MGRSLSCDSSAVQQDVHTFKTGLRFGVYGCTNGPEPKEKARRGRRQWISWVSNMQVRRRSRLECHFNQVSSSTGLAGLLSCLMMI